MNNLWVRNQAWQIASYEISWMSYGEPIRFGTPPNNHQPNTTMAMPTGPSFDAESVIEIQTINLPNGRTIRVRPPIAGHPAYVGPYTHRLIPRRPPEPFDRIQFIDSLGREIPITFEDRPLMADEVMRDVEDGRNPFRRETPLDRAEREMREQEFRPAPVPQMTAQENERLREVLTRPMTVMPEQMPGHLFTGVDVAGPAPATPTGLDLDDLMVESPKRGIERLHQVRPQQSVFDKMPF